MIELVERLDAAASELLACVRRGGASSEELVGVLAGTKAVRGKLDILQAVAAASVAGSRGHGDGGAHVLAESAGMHRRDARSQVKTAAAVGAVSVVQDAVEEGRMPLANARQLADAVDKTSASDVESDGELLAKAESLPPDQFAKEAKRWTAQRQADGGDSQYRRQRARRAVRIWNGDDGMVHLYGQFDPVTGRRIRSRLDREAHRLHDADKRQARGLTGTDKDSAHRLHDSDKNQARGGGVRSLPQCMADAFENMTAGAVGSGRPCADIALVARLDPESEELMASTADGDPLPASVVERFAGESSWFGLVLSARGVPMWKGRNIRRATESQFQALMALYGGCAGCGETDEHKIHAHHMDPFAWGGRTDLDNLMPLCWGCHDKIHDHGWQVVDAGDGKHTIKPPDRIHHGAAHLPDTTPLFAPAGSPHRSEPDPRAVPGSDALSGGSGGGAGGGRSSGGGSGGGAGGGRSSNGSRAGPTGPQAARDALRKARAATHEARSVLV